VSTRTIYNHFQDKAHLFQIVIEESAARVADAQIALMDRHLHKVTDIEGDLIAFGRAWLTPTPDHAEHYALVRQVNADAAHIPSAAIDGWLETGPLRVRRELARRLQELADTGLLRLDDPDRAALHFSQLVSISDPAHGRTARTDDEIADSVTSAVRAFLYGYSA
jgi:AcrR family transcriptional regulator